MSHYFYRTSDDAFKIMNLTLPPSPFPFPPLLKERTILPYLLFKLLFSLTDFASLVLTCSQVYILDGFDSP